MVKLWALAGLFAVVGVACALPDPCSDYVDYMCECHAEDEGVDCAELQETYAVPDASVTEQCSIDLANQEAEDDSTGACAGSSDDTDIQVLDG